VLPVVGDRVVFRVNRGEDSGENTGLILSVRERKSVFARSVSGGRRKKILGANLDYVFLIHAVKNPALNPRLIDRMAVAAEYGGIEPVICINKLDLAEDIEALEDTAEVYRRAGYTVCLCSALTGEGMGRLRTLMEGRITLMAGPSGAGKTSIISVLQPGLDIRTGEVSERTGKGRHTTSHLELHPLASGGYMGDTPGIRGFGIELVDKSGLQDCFVEFRKFNGCCRFKTCLHKTEPGCAVKEALENGEVSRRRHESYLRMLEELEEQDSRY
jgi:ribosome biogenesis GTPase